MFAVQPHDSIIAPIIIRTTKPLTPMLPLYSKEMHIIAINPHLVFECNRMRITYYNINGGFMVSVLQECIDGYFGPIEECPHQWGVPASIRNAIAEIKKTKRFVS